MSPEETIAFPNQNRYTDTPESLEECLPLVGHIDTMLAMWKSAAHHPSSGPLRIAELIQADCQPPEGPVIDYAAQTGFGGKYTHEQAKYLADHDEAKRALANILADPTLDTLTINDYIVAQYISIIETFSNNPMALGLFKEAVTKLRRIIILREQVAQKNSTASQRAKETSDYIEIIKSLAGSLMS